MTKRKQEEHQLQQWHTLYNDGDVGSWFRGPLICKRTFGSVYFDKPVMAVKSSVLASLNNFNSPSAEVKNNTSVGASLTKTNQDDVVLPPIKIKLKLPPKPSNPTEDQRESRFFDSSTSPETIGARFVSELDRIKASVVSSIKKTDDSLACYAATEIEYKCEGDCEDDPFLVKKELEVSDVGGLCRFMFRKDSVESYILPFWGPDQKGVVQSGTGVRITIYDKDTGSYHKLTLKRWSSNKSYILNNNWMKEFVNRRSLKVGDTIGLYWDSFYSDFCFSLLNRSGHK